ncbi:MAG: hypothetical protein GQ527_06495 [Bacteroidales bacterium]|nr:hypothetical protein [Bacteroidales bacterium]
MLRHYNIEHKGKSSTPGFGFESYKYATEHQLSGSVTFQTENNCLIQIEGSAENTAAFISWYLTGVRTENPNEVAINSGPLQGSKEFIINNSSDTF